MMYGHMIVKEQSLSRFDSGISVSADRTTADVVYCPCLSAD